MDLYFFERNTEITLLYYIWLLMLKALICTCVKHTTIVILSLKSFFTYIYTKAQKREVLHLKQVLKGRVFPSEEQHVKRPRGAGEHVPRGTAGP